MMLYLLDSNVFREIGKSVQHVNVAKWLGTVDDHGLAISVLTVREIRYGIESLRARKPDIAREIDERVGKGFALYGDRILHVTEAVANEWGRLLAESNRHVDDTGIAATAKVNGLVMVTRNTDDFRGRGIALLNPFKSPPETLAP